LISTGQVGDGSKMLYKKTGHPSKNGMLYLATETCD